MSTRNALPFVSQKTTKNSAGGGWRGYFQKNWEGVCDTLPETLTLFQTKICDFPYPILDVIKNLIPYFRPEALEPSAWLERVTSCYGTYAVIGINIKREMVLSQNDEEVANSSKKHTKFKSRRHKPYPISDENGRIDTLFQNKTAQKKHTLWHGTYLYRLYRGISPPRAKNAWQIVNVLIISIILAKRYLHNDVS